MDSRSFFSPTGRVAPLSFPRRPFVALPAAALLATLLGGGCLLPGREGPVSQSLVASRDRSQQGVAAMERGQWERAEELLAQAVETCPVDPEARRHYAQALWHHGRREEAIAELEEAARLAVDDAALHVLLAEKRLAMGRIQAAARSAQRAIDLDPDLAEAWAMRGRVRRAVGQPHRALADYLRVLGLAPDHQAVLLETAELYRELNEPERALAALQALADTYPTQEEPQQVFYLQGLAYAALKRWDEAAETLAAASLREPPNPELLCRLAEAELRAGNPIRAARAARNALAMDPGHEPSRRLLGQAELVLQPGGAVLR